MRTHNIGFDEEMAKIILSNIIKYALYLCFCIKIVFCYYSKVPKFSDTKKLCCNLPKIQIMEPNLRVFRQKDANGITNSEDPDQTAPLGAVWSGSALFPQTYLSLNLCSLRYYRCMAPNHQQKIFSPREIIAVLSAKMIIKIP